MKRLSVLSGFIVDTYGQPETIFSIAVWDELRALRRRLTGNPDFCDLNDRTKNGLYLWVLDLYATYLRQAPRASDKAAVQKVEKRELSNISTVLHDPKYALLSTSLAMDGIKSVEQLKGLNIWRYMNERGLYELKDRVATVDGVITALDAHQRLASVPERRDAPKEPRPTVPLARPLLSDEIAASIKKKGPTPSTVEDVLADTKRSPSMRSIIRNSIDQMPRIVEISDGQYIHRDCIVDVDNAAAKMLDILTSHFEQFDGYSNRQILFDAARMSLFMFINDNSFDDDASIYNLAKHLFAKEGYGGNWFVFFGNVHIWREEPNYPKSIKGLLINLARNSDGVLSEDDCMSFLEKTRLHVAGVNQALQIGYDSTFLQHASDRYILAESLGVDEAWKLRITDSLRDLFEGREYIIPSDIDPQWFERLPGLPAGLHWTPLLLQEVLRYFPDLGYRSIQATSGQALDTVHPAIVLGDSAHQTFADVVHDHLRSAIELPRRMEADELRSHLIEAGMIQGNKLLSSRLRYALDDHRFAWTYDGKTVQINPR
jgi:hypothetical protein